MNSIPWVEKYRPTHFEDIVLDNVNKQILGNILKNNAMPNLLFYGPPGTGKTTTIINLIQKYGELNNYTGKDLVIHLNASDERGIDIIRNQISQFVNSKNIFGHGIKFVILDEVDYMTKNAQHALKHLICSYHKNVRFCLICNYISKLKKCLQDEFLKLRFSQLPSTLILEFLKGVCCSEKIMIADSTLVNIQIYFGSDIRSMINYLQANQNNLSKKILLTDDVYKTIVAMIKKKDCHHSISKHIYNICNLYNIERKEFMKNICYYLLRTCLTINMEFIKSIKFVFHHNRIIDIDYVLGLLIYSIKGSDASLDSL